MSKIVKLYEYVKFVDLFDKIKEMFPTLKVFKFGKDVFVKNDIIDLNIRVIGDDKFKIFDNKDSSGGVWGKNLKEEFTSEELIDFIKIKLG